METFETTMETLCRKTVKEIFQHGLRKIAVNIADPNTSVKEPRTLTVTFTFKVFPDRSGASVKAKSKEGLSSLDLSSAEDTVYIAKVNGVPMMFSRDTRQELLFTEEHAVVPDGKSRGANDDMAGGT